MLEPTPQKTAKQIFKQISNTILDKFKPIELVCLSKQIVRSSPNEGELSIVATQHIKPEVPCKIHPKSMFYNTKNKCVSCAVAEGRMKRKK